MSGTLGNRNAEKWNLEHTLAVLALMNMHSLDDTIMLLGQSLTYVGLYPELWSRLRRKWQDNDDIYDRMRIIELRFENKLILAALRGDIRNGPAQLVMRTKYGYTDYKSDRAELAMQAEEIASLREELRSYRPDPGPQIEEEPSVSPPAIIPVANKGTFSLRSSGAVGSDYLIRDQDGREFMRAPITSDIQQICMDDPPRGIYTLAITGRQHSRRVVFGVNPDPK